MLLAEELAVLLQPILLPVHLKAAHAAFSKKGSCHWPSRHVQADWCDGLTVQKFDKRCTVTGSYGFRPQAQAQALLVATSCHEHHNVCAARFSQAGIP